MIVKCATIHDLPYRLWALFMVTTMAAAWILLFGR
jgi:hypothetical protein